MVKIHYRNGELRVEKQASVNKEFSLEKFVGTLIAATNEDKLEWIYKDKYYYVSLTTPSSGARSVYVRDIGESRYEISISSVEERCFVWLKANLYKAIDAYRDRLMEAKMEESLRTVEERMTREKEAR